MSVHIRSILPFKNKGERDRYNLPCVHLLHQENALRLTLYEVMAKIKGFNFALSEESWWAFHGTAT